jgi:glutamine synthetase
MHIHQSVVDAKTGANIFSDEAGDPTQLFFAFIGGSQKYLPAVTCMLAPYVNSYRRLIRSSSAPVNVMWGYDNRTVGLRVPFSEPAARRLENRLPSSDANPYLAIAASLACGYLGMIERMKPTKQIEGSAYRLPHTLPRTLYEALNLFNSAKKMRGILGDRFMRAMTLVKQSELEAYQGVISSWEREHLLLNV